MIFTWTRSTVHYETESIQRATRVMSTQIKVDRLIEAIGVAALANGIVRLAAILE